MNASMNDPKDRLDVAVARRLAALRAMPVDVSRLSRAVEAQIPRPARHVENVPWHARLGWMRPLRAVAASVLLLGLVGALIVASSSGPVLASTDRLLQVHQAVLSGHGHTVPVPSIEAANGELARQWPQAPRLPTMEHDQVMSCCVHRVGRQRVACAAMKIDGVAVSMAVADAADIKMPEGQKVRRDGVTYHVQSAGAVNMAMTERHGRWACLMGDLPVDRLIDMLDGLQW